MIFDRSLNTKTVTTKEAESRKENAKSKKQNARSKKQKAKSKNPKSKKEKPKKQKKSHVELYVCAAVEDFDTAAYAP